MHALSIVPKTELDRIRGAGLAADDRLGILADACRLNALVAVKRAGSGHLGSTFSAMEVVAYLLFEELNTATVGWGSPDRDVYFSSKGHDVPGLYSVLYALGVIPTERLLRLRKLGDLEGPRDRVGEAPPRAGRTSRRHGRRRGAPGGSELRGLAGGRAREALGAD